jgi:hypothetical protein
MMIRRYAYEVTGTSAGGGFFHVTGSVGAEFGQVFSAVIQQTFDDLHNGRAIDGVRCRGPFIIDKVSIERIADHER